jgi:membrane protein
VAPEPVQAAVYAAGTRGVRERAPGGALAVLLWLAASLGSRSTSRTSARTTGCTSRSRKSVVFLAWLWMSNLTLLVGAQFNAELAKLSRGAGS